MPTPWRTPCDGVGIALQVRLLPFDMFTSRKSLSQIRRNGRHGADQWWLHLLHRSTPRTLLAVAAIFAVFLFFRILDSHSSYDYSYEYDNAPILGFKYKIFYNIYINPESQDNAYRIIAEQLGQIATSFLGSNSGFQQPNGESRTSIYYTTIGAKPDIGRIASICKDNNLACQHRKHYDTGFEEVTLQDLYEYCRDQVPEIDDTVRVAYMHSKGSYNNLDGNINDIWRWHLTLALSHKHCWHPPQSTCNACGLDFWPTWTLFFPGNMWTAKCSYVRKLVPPVDFRKALGNNHQQVMEIASKQQPGLLSVGLFQGENMWPPESDRFGLERYANEHWIGSHPDLIPCDMSPRKADHNLWTSSKEPRLERPGLLQWTPSPRHDFPIGDGINDDFWFALTYQRELKQPILQDEKARKREYFLLPGYLFKWILLYQQVPPPNSWAWRWFPDGKYWMEETQKHGIAVLEKTGLVY